LSKLLIVISEINPNPESIDEFTRHKVLPKFIEILCFVMLSAVQFKNSLLWH